MINRWLLVVVAVLVSLSACSSGEDEASGSRPANSTLAATNVSLDGVVHIADAWKYRAVRGSTTTDIDLQLPTDRVAPERFAWLDKLAETADGAVVILDSYASRAEGRCTEGREVFVHVFSLPKRKALFERLVASCVEGTAPPQPYASVAAGMLSIGAERFLISADAVTQK